ncbi:RING finger protein 223 [Coregonus clupeaformis]|uniref:RING finger protein 223 n=1 Tax=Coregonus clupeaformis TaxID=59861 RepID=UPI001E1C3437|nr:RING finger protein 223 [Coregonus clupeaformis]
MLRAPLTSHCCPPVPAMDPYQEPDLGFQSPLDEGAPDLECAICFSQFNNVFRTPKMLQCNHTFCLECLARMNVKSAKPDCIQCPLCRGLTPLPDLGLPKLTTDPAVLSYLPAAMQRVYSIRFNRNKGKLQVKRTTDGPPPLNSLRSVSHSLDVGLPSSPGGSGRGDVEAGQGGRLGGLMRLFRRPACRASLLVSAVMMMVLLTCIIIFLLAYKWL